MLSHVEIGGEFVSLICEAVRYAPKRRRLAGEAIAAIVRRYGVARERSDRATLLGLGRELYRWLDGEEGWLGALRPQLTPPWILELRSGRQPDAAVLLVLQAPWELLADDHGFLAEDGLLRFAVARRCGAPLREIRPHDYRLGVGFMAAAPRGAVELDYEAEEAAILAAAPDDVDLIVEDSGEPKELGKTLSEFAPPLPVLHLSSHGHNVWRANATAAPQAVLLMEDVHGGEQPTSAAALIGALEPYRPQLLFLSACLSAAASEGGAGAVVTDPLASTLVQAGLACVLGWDGSVADVAATAFARELYDGLSRRQSIVEAAAGARRALLTGGAAEGSASKDMQGNPGLEGQLAAERDALRRDWHLARVWLGRQGGGPVVGGVRKRSLLPADHAYKQVLARKGDDRLVVAGPAMFVGRRRELQEALQVLDGNRSAGVLLHGMGRLGKTSLAVRIASRRRDLRLVVVYRDYDALSVLDALATTLQDHRPARTLLERRRAAVQRDATALEAVLIDLLSGPCQQVANGDKPILLLIDDLEQILESMAENGRRRVREPERGVLRAVLRAFEPVRSESRLLVTSRFPFSLIEGEVELAGKLHALQLSPFNENAQRKLSRRQVEAAQTREEPGAALDEAGLTSRLPLLARAQVVARGNPGLQDLVGDRLVLRPAVPPAQAAAVLQQMEDYLSGGALPSDEDVRGFLQNLALDELLAQAGSAGRALLRAALLFEVPVPEPAIAALTAKLGGTAGALRALGLLDPFEDIVDHRRTALAVNGLTAGRLQPLTEAEKAALAPLCLPVLFAVWGGAAPEAAARRPYMADIELTRLGLLAGNAEVVAVCAADAVQGLQRNQPAVAAALGQAAIDLLEGAGREPSLRLLAETGEAFGTAGDGEAAAAVLMKGEDRLDTAAAQNLSPGELNRFLFARGNRQVTAGDLDAAQSSFERLSMIAGNEHERAVARGRLADILFARGDLDEALRIRREEELPVYTRLGDVRELAVAQGQIADILFARGDLDEALRIRREEELPVYTRLGDVRELAVTQGQIADILFDRGDLDEALRIRREDQLPVYTRLGDVRELAVTQGQIADILFARGDLDEALRILREEVLSAFTRLGAVRELAVTQGRIADILFARGDLDEALRIRREDQLPVYTRLGNVRAIAVAQGQIADILFARGDLDEALRIRREDQLPVYTRLGDVRELAVAQGQIADILFARGDLDEALRIRREDQLPVYTRLGAVRELAVTQGQIADILFARGDLDEALRILREEVLSAFTRLGAVRELAGTQGRIADILFARGDLDEALRIRREDQLPVYTRLGDVRELAVTQGQIADILFARGDLDEALRIRREEELPVYTRLGAVRELAVTQGQIADILFARGDLDEALRIRREEELPVYTRLGAVRELAVTQGQIADILFARGDLDEVLRILREEVLSAFTRLGAVRELAVAQGRIADILFARGDLDEALRIRREDQLPVYTRLGDVRAIAVAQGRIADILFARGDLDEALRIRREDQLPVYTRLGDVRELAVTQGQIADILFARGDLDEALRIRREEVLSAFTRLGAVRELAITQGQIADILFARGDLDEALRILREEVLSAFTRLGAVRELAGTQGRIADILFARGDLDEALRIRREDQLPVYTRLGNVRELAVAQGRIANILFARGDLDEALRIRREEELPVYTRLGAVRELAVTQGQIADILFARGDLTGALELQRQRLGANRKLRAVDGIAAALWDLARIELAQENIKEAFAHLVEAWPLLLQLGRAEGIAVVGRTLGQILLAADQKDEGLSVLRSSAAAFRKLGRIPEAQELEEIIARLL